MTARLGASYWKLWVASVVSNFGDGVAIVAYPWLASAVTRNPIHIAAVLVVTRLPWLLFSLPAGVVTDRVDRRKLVAWMDVVRFLLTLGVALVVLGSQSQLSSPEEIAAGTAPLPGNAGVLLVMIYVAASLLGTAEVFRDNSAQTLLPGLVDEKNLEKANGRLWGAEAVMNSFVGPPLGGLFLAIAFALPFFVDAGTFVVAAALVFSISGRFQANRERASSTSNGRAFWADLKEGVRWLWGHPLFRPMAIALGVINGLFMVSFSTYVLFVQEVLELDATMFGLLLTAAAVGSVIGSLAASWLSGAIGQGGSLFLTIIIFAVTLVVTGLTSSFWVVWAMLAVSSVFTILWNVITVSLRQSLIPDGLLGRVNSVYRFIGWGMMPIGSLLGGLIVAIVEPSVGREWALRAPFLFAAAGSLVLYVYALPRLNSARIDAARPRDAGQETEMSGSEGV